MENKKLVKILLKDMTELEELIAEMKSARRFDALEMEFIHTRAKGILQLMQLFNTQNEETPNHVQKEIEKVEELKETVEKEAIISEEPQPEEEPEKMEKEEEPHKPGPEPVKEELQVSEMQDAVQDERRDEEIVQAEPVQKEPDEEDEEMLAEESEKTEANSRLGDSFLKGKSVNDLITEQTKLEFKLSNRPVSSIQAAIGINDRFQYIRELFDGDNQRFMEAVKTLDAKDNIKEAVDYLRQNYKWRKNETSLKFVNLVKRRFLNE